MGFWSIGFIDKWTDTLITRLPPGKLIYLIRAKLYLTSVFERVNMNYKVHVTQTENSVTKGEQAMRAVAYLRVSTADQAGEDRFGLGAQQEAIEAYSQREGVEVLQWYIDEGYSGATIDRPGLQQLMTAAGEKTFDTVLLPKMDRLSRDVFIALFLEKELLINGVQIFSVTEPVNGKSPMDKAFRQMMSVFAELEKSMITLRMSGGRKQKARGGGYSGGQAALG